MKNYVVIGAVALVVIGGLWVANTRTAKAPRPVVCTMEAKLCPDGSAVGRTGPNCEFAPCPAASVTSTTGGEGGGILPYNSGVRGTVSLGPTCPVQRIPPDPACADKPYATTIDVVLIVGGRGVLSTQVKSDANGEFRFSLPPGPYILKAGDPANKFPRCADVDVIVPVSGFSTTTISCDTGIR